MLGGRYLEALHPQRQRTLVVSLDQEMDVRSLQAEVHDPEVLTARSRERRFTDRLIRAPPAQIADCIDHAQYDVNRIPSMEKWPLLVRCPRPLAPGRPASPASLAAALLEQHQLLGLCLSPGRTTRTLLAGHHADWITPESKSRN
jgi:hypothetical protein